VDKSTTPDDITAQLLAYLVQDEMVSWEEIAPWVTHYDQQYGCSRPEAVQIQRMKEFAFPLRANALRPMRTKQPPGTMSLPQAAKALGLTEHATRDLIARGYVHSVIRQGRFSYISVAEVERLADDEAIKAARSRCAAKLRRKKDKPSEADEDELEARIAELEIIKELATTPEECHAVLEALEEAYKQCRQLQQGSDT
jgi:hypothetical protein